MVDNIPAAAPVRLQSGDVAPDFTLPDLHGKPVSLAGFRGRRVVVYFYPAAMTPGCTTEACDFRDSLDALKASGIEVLGISPDPLPKLRAFTEHHHLTFPLLSDEERSVMTAYGAYGQKSLYGKVVTGVIRSTFVVDPEGRVEIASYNVRAKGHVAKLRAELGV